MFARFQVTHCTAGRIEVVTDEGVQVWTPGDAYAVVGEQGTLWTGTWPRLRPPCLCVGEHVCGDENATACAPGRPELRLIQGGKA